MLASGNDSASVEVVEEEEVNSRLHLVHFLRCSRLFLPTIVIEIRLKELIVGFRSVRSLTIDIRTYVPKTRVT